MVYHTFSHYLSPSPCEITYSNKRYERNNVITLKPKRVCSTVFLPLARKWQHSDQIRPKLALCLKQTAIGKFKM